MNKWRKRTRRFHKDFDYAVHELELHKRRLQDEMDTVNDFYEREATALNKAEELRRDNVKLATELARVHANSTVLRLAIESEPVEPKEERHENVGERIARLSLKMKEAPAEMNRHEKAEWARRAIEGDAKEET